MKDPYQILGVSRGASNTEIKRAYRKLAKKLHPDRNSGNPVAAERFKEVASARTILTDPDQRAKYDRRESNNAAPQRSRTKTNEATNGSGASPDKSPVDETLTDYFGKRWWPRKELRRKTAADRTYSLTIGFLEAAKGVRKRISLHGGKTLEVRIPPGVKPGQQVRLKGQGKSGRLGAKPGDAFVEVTVKPHAFFTREDDDIHLKLPVTLPEAVLGGKVKVPTVDGSVTMSIPKGSNSGHVLRLKGKGVVKSGGKARGDQYVTITVALPEKIDKDLEELVTRWAANHDYDVRKALKRQ